VAEVDLDVRAAVDAAVPPVLGDRVESGEDAVADVAPADLVDACVDAVGGGPGDRLGEVGRVGEHLARNAADIETGTAERTVLDDRHIQVREGLVDDVVAGAGADDDQVVMAHPARVGADRRIGSSWRRRGRGQGRTADRAHPHRRTPKYSGPPDGTRPSGGNPA
jgi:hypothetical protein